MQVIGQAITAALLLNLLVACGCRRDEAPLTYREAGFVAFVGVGEDDPVWPVLRASATRLHVELGLSKVPLRTAAPPTSSVNAQRNLIRKLHDEGMNALCVQVSDPKGLVSTLDALAAQGVQIVTMMNPVRSTPPFIHAGPDDAAVGEALADALYDVLDGRGTAVLLHADSGSEASARRHVALVERLKSYPSIAVLFERDCQGSPDRARDTIAELMQRYPRLGAWVATDNCPLRKHADGPVSLPKSCRVVAVDPVPGTWWALEDGVAAAMIAVDYGAIAEHALTTCITLTLGEARIPTSFSAGVRIVKPAELDAFKTQWRRWTSDSAADLEMSSP